jgi:hypothetical protein
VSSGRQDLQGRCSAIHREKGHALAGEMVIAQARQIGRVIVLPGTSTHKIQEIVLRSNVLCLLDRPFRLIDEKRGGLRLREDGAGGA